MEKFFGRIFWGRIFLGGFFWEDFLGGFLRRILGGILWEELFVLLDVEGIDLFVKILVFVKILSKSTRKEEKFRSLEVRRKLIALKNLRVVMFENLDSKCPVHLIFSSFGFWLIATKDQNISLF